MSQYLLIKFYLCTIYSNCFVRVLGKRLDVGELLRIHVRNRTNTVLLSSSNSVKSSYHPLETF